MRSIRIAPYVCVALLLLAFNSVAIARPLERQIIGKITDAATGELLPGAVVNVKGSQISSAANEDGVYRITVPDNATVLVVSFVGYNTREISLGNSNVLNITLNAIVGDMEDVVVVGYATQKRGQITGAVSSVGEEAFKNRPLTHLGQGLQGQIPNLNITFGDGQPNRSASFNVRGYNSLSGGSPLVLVDGVPGNINFLNPEDVSSVTVLKDAAASAIYGGQAAFGVILVTTKNAKQGKPKIRYTNNVGISNPIRVPDVMDDPLEAAKIQNEAYNGYIGTDGPGMLAIIDYLEQRKADPSLPELGFDASGNFIHGANIDWYDMFYKKNAVFTKNFASVSGANENTGYYISGGHEFREGMFNLANDKYNRYSGRIKLDQRIASWLKITNNTDYNYSLYDAPNKFVSSGYNIYRYMSLYANPYNAVKTANGNYTYYGMLAFGQLENAGRDWTISRIFKNIFSAQADIIKDKLRLNGDYTYFLSQSGGDQQYFNMDYEIRKDEVVNFTNPDYFESSIAERNEHIVNLYANYTNTFGGDHNFNALIGMNQHLFPIKLL